MVTFMEIKALNLTLEVVQMWPGTLETPLHEHKITIAPGFGRMK